MRRADDGIDAVRAAGLGKFAFGVFQLFCGESLA